MATRPGSSRTRCCKPGLSRHLQIIGEAARALPAELRAQATDIPCPKIVGMRNVLMHGYFDIDTGIVWHAVTHVS